MHWLFGACMHERGTNFRSGAAMSVPQPPAAPESCDFFHGVRLNVRASWANGDGVGVDMELHLPRWLDSQVELTLPRTMPGLLPVTHAVVREGVKDHPLNFIATRKTSTLTETLGIANCKMHCVGNEEIDVGRTGHTHRVQSHNRTLALGALPRLCTVMCVGTGRPP